MNYKDVVYYDLYKKAYVLKDGTEVAVEHMNSEREESLYKYYYDQHKEKIRRDRWARYFLLPLQWILIVLGIAIFVIY